MWYFWLGKDAESPMLLLRVASVDFEPQAEEVLRDNLWKLYS